MIKFFNPGKGYLKIKSEIDSEIQRVLEAGDLILRKDVEIFEESLAEFVGTQYAIGLNSGTDALYLTLRYLGIGQGDHILVPSYTFVATVQVVKQVGAIPVLYDLDGKTEYDLEALMQDKSLKAVMVAHLEGSFDRNFDKFLEFSKKYDIPIIEDACQSIGATKDGRKAGSIGLVGAFSFYPAKILGAYGDAGALTTNDKKLYDWVKEARNHFKNTNKDWGINSRMDNLQAAMLNVKFKYLPQFLARREEIAMLYYNCLHPEILPERTPGRVWQDFVVNVGDRRNELSEFLKNRGIETLKNNYPFPISKLPLAQKYEDETLRLPCNETIENKEVVEVIESIKEFYAQ